MAETAPGRRVHRRWVVTAVAVVVAASVALAIWQLLARSALADVEAVPTSLVCDGKPVPLALPDDDDLLPEPAFAFTIHLHTVCHLTVAYVNDGSRAVRADSALFPMLYPGDTSGVVIDITGSDGSIRPRSERGGLDARFTVGRTIEPGDWIEETYVLRYRQPVGTCSGGTAGLSDLPVTTFSSMGVRRVVDGRTALSIRSTGPEGATDSCS